MAAARLSTTRLRVLTVTARGFAAALVRAAVGQAAAFEGTLSSTYEKGVGTSQRAFGSALKG